MDIWMDGWMGLGLISLISLISHFSFQEQTGEQNGKLIEYIECRSKAESESESAPEPGPGPGPEPGPGPDWAAAAAAAASD